MLTVIFLILIVGAAIGGIYLAMSSGMRGGRHNKASMPVVRDQESSNPRGDVRSGNGIN